MYVTFVILLIKLLREIDNYCTQISKNSYWHRRNERIKTQTINAVICGLKYSLRCILSA